MREHPRAPVVMTPPSRMLIERMLHNSSSVMDRQREEQNIPDYPLFTHDEIDRLAHRLTAIPFGQSKRIHGAREEIEITFHQAGHVAGAAGVEIRHKQRKLFFTGDVLFEPQRTLAGAKFPAGPFDTLVMETTRGTTERPEGKGRMNEVVRLIDTINDTLQRGGSMLVPVFALGRMQEILAILHDARKFGRLVESPIYASGLGMDLCGYFDEISRKTKHLQFTHSIVKELKIRPLPRKFAAGVDPQENALYILSSGMLVEKTPSYVMASCLAGHARNTIGFVGYCDPDTAGGHLLAAKAGETFLFEAVDVKAKLKAKIERFELSGHADRDELLDFALQATPRAIVLTHGDPPARAWFQQALTTRAPEIKVLDPVPLQSYQV
jgi:Cft2 family RNA processing exonuclease